MKVRTRPLLLVAAVLAGTVVPLAAPAVADAGPVPLGMATFADIVVDEGHGRLFVSGGPRGDGIRVTDLSGAHVAMLAFRGATGMALSSDGSDLWVALPDFGLVQLDTATLTAERRLPLPTGQCAGDVALVDDRVVYGYSCNQYLPAGGGYGGIGLVDAVTGTVLGTVTSGPFYRPVVEAAANGRVYAADAGLSPTDLHVYDVTGAAPVEQGHRPAVCSNLQDLVAAPLGGQVVTACGGTYEHEAWSLDLAPAGTYFSGPYPNAGAWSADGSVFAAGLRSPYEPDVYVHRAGDGDAETALREVELGAETSVLEPGGLAASHDGGRVWAVARTATGGLALHVLDVPLAGSSRVTVAAQPSALYAGRPATLTGRLTDSTGAPLAGVALDVTRAATGAAPAALAPVVTAADGSFTLVDTPPTAGTWAYLVANPADAALAQTTVLAWSTDTRLTLAVKPDGAGVYGALTLRYDGPDPGVRTVSLTRTGGGMRISLPAAEVDSWGAGKFLDRPGPGSWTYEATVAAAGVHPAASATSTVALLTPTTLTVDVPAGATAGAPLRVSGVLSGSAGPVVGASVTVRRGGCGTTSWTQSVVTTPNGSWSVTDAAPPVGTCTYSASYAGSPAYAPSTGTGTTTVGLASTVLTAAAPAGLAGSPLAVAGRLSSGTTALAGGAVSVVRSGCATASWTGTATTAVDGSWSVTDPAPPAGQCTYRATFAGTATSSRAEASASAAVAYRGTSLTLSVVRGTGSAKKTVSVTGQLGATSTNRTLTITAQPVGGKEQVLVSAGRVDAAGRLTVVHTPKGTTTYRVSFAGDAWYAPVTVEAVQ